MFQFDSYSRKFKVVDPSQMCRGPTGTDRRPLSVANGDHAAGSSAGYENQASNGNEYYQLNFCKGLILVTHCMPTSAHLFCY